MFHSTGTYQERLASYWAKMLQRIRNVLQVTGRRCYNVSGTSCKLLDEDATTYQERLASYWTKMLQRIRNVLQVTGRRCYDVSGTSCKLLDEDVTTYQEIIIDNADHRMLLLHPPNPPPTPPKKKRQCTKVTTVPPLEGRRHLKHLQSTVRHYWQKLKPWILEGMAHLVRYFYIDLRQNNMVIYLQLLNIWITWYSPWDTVYIYIQYYIHI